MDLSPASFSHIPAGLAWVEIDTAIGERLWSVGLAKGSLRDRDGCEVVCVNVLWKADGATGMGRPAPKYIKRVPKPGGGYRYYYAAHEGGGVHNAAHFGVGSSFAHSGGHFHIKGEGPDGMLHVEHSHMPGQRVQMTRDELAAKLKEHHGAALETHRKGVLERFIRDIGQAAGKRKEALEKKAEKYGYERPKAEGAEKRNLPLAIKSSIKGERAEDRGQGKARGEASLHGDIAREKDRDKLRSMLTDQSKIMNNPSSSREAVDAASERWRAISDRMGALADEARNIANQKAQAESEARQSERNAKYRARQSAIDAMGEPAFRRAMKFIEKPKTKWDTVRPELRGVYVKDGVGYASDGSRVIAFPAHGAADGFVHEHGPSDAGKPEMAAKLESLMRPPSGGAESSHAAKDVREWAKRGERIRLGSDPDAPVVPSEQLKQAIEAANGKVRLITSGADSPVHIIRADGERHVIMPFNKDSLKGSEVAEVGRSIEARAPAAGQKPEPAADYDFSGGAPDKPGAKPAEPAPGNKPPASRVEHDLNRSSNVKHVSWDPEKPGSSKGAMRVHFDTGAVHEYSGVHHDDYNKVVTADSPGAAFNEHIKKLHESKQLRGPATGQEKKEAQARQREARAGARERKVGESMAKREEAQAAEKKAEPATKPSMPATKVADDDISAPDAPMSPDEEHAEHVRQRDMLTNLANGYEREAPKFPESERPGILSSAKDMRKKAAEHHAKAEAIKPTEKPKEAPAKPESKSEPAKPEAKAESPKPAAETPKPAERHTYGSTLRPLSIGTHPKGPVEFGAHPDFPFGTVTYDKPLSREDADHFSLKKIAGPGDREKLVGKIADRMREYAQEYLDLDPRDAEPMVGQMMQQSGMHFPGGAGRGSDDAKAARTEMTKHVMEELRKRFAESAPAPKLAPKPHEPTAESHFANAKDTYGLSDKDMATVRKIAEQHVKSHAEAGRHEQAKAYTRDAVQQVLAGTRNMSPSQAKKWMREKEKANMKKAVDDHTMARAGSALDFIIKALGKPLTEAQHQQRVEAAKHRHQGAGASSSAPVLYSMGHQIGTMHRDAPGEGRMVFHGSGPEESRTLHADHRGVWGPGQSHPDYRPFIHNDMLDRHIGGDQKRSELKASAEAPKYTLHKDGPGKGRIEYHNPIPGGNPNYRTVHHENNWTYGAQNHPDYRPEHLEQLKSLISERGEHGAQESATKSRPATKPEPATSHGDYAQTKKELDRATRAWLRGKGSEAALDAAQKAHDKAKAAIKW